MPRTTLFFCMGSWPFLLLSLRQPNFLRGAFLSATLLRLLGSALKGLIGISSSHLIDLGAYDVGTCFGRKDSTPRSEPPQHVKAYTTILWFIVMVHQDLCFFFAPLFRSVSVSWERFYRNAWWLEREVSEAFNVFFFKKHDRRSLFMLPLVYQAPFSKVFPVGGFFELVLGRFDRTLAWRHLVWAI